MRCKFSALLILYYSVIQIFKEIKLQVLYRYFRGSLR